MWKSSKKGAQSTAHLSPPLATTGNNDATRRISWHIGTKLELEVDWKKRCARERFRPRVAVSDWATRHTDTH